jgi:catechol 2,3-dioxygenase-like lactoylglutathione lyase family enzyme
MFLHHITITTPPDKLAAMSEFYENLCGLESKISPTEGALWYEMPGTENGAQLHIYITPEATPLPNGAHIAFVVGGDDQRGLEIYERVIAWAKKNGVFLGAGTPYWGSPRAYVFDPAGNRIELMQYAP